MKSMHPEDSILLQWYDEPATREKGFTALVAKYQQPLYWHVRRMVINHADADDVLQNIFLKVWKGLALPDCYQ
jgi:RNA polymerase sigma-70 factor (ECF subfamily)